MPSFNKTLNSNKQFIIKVVKSSNLEKYSSGEARELIINAPSKRALIDTGASNTCLSQECADELELIPIGKTSITTASNNCDVNKYTLDLAIPVTTTVLEPIKKNDGKETFVEQVIGEEHWAHVQQSIHSIPKINRDKNFTEKSG